MRPPGGGDPAIIPDVARGILGLDDEEANVLFAATNSLETIEAIVKDLANGENIVELEAQGDYEKTRNPEE